MKITGCSSGWSTRHLAREKRSSASTITLLPPDKLVPPLLSLDSGHWLSRVRAALVNFLWPCARQSTPRGSSPCSLASLQHNPPTRGSASCWGSVSQQRDTCQLTEQHGGAHPRVLRFGGPQCQAVHTGLREQRSLSQIFTATAWL